MKGKLGLILHLAALVVAAFCAYLVFSAGKAKTDKGKVILDVEPDQLARLAFDTGKKQVVAVAREGGGFTMTVTEQIHKPVAMPKKEKGEKDKPPAAPEGTAKVAAKMITETTVNTYRASQEFEKTLARLLPLRAERDLGKVDDKKLLQFGMVEAGRTLIVEAQKQKVTYLIGAQTYGGATTYVQQQPEGPVYLISSTLIRSLDVRATRYLERRLVGVEKKNVERVAVGTLTASREFMQQKREKKRNIWVPADSPDTPSDLFTNWVERAFRLGATEYLAQDPIPPPKPEFKLMYFRGSKKLDELHVASAEAEAGKRDFFARSGFTGGWVKLRRQDAEAVVNDLANVLEQ
jgi:hypothetical protein